MSGDKIHKLREEGPLIFSTDEVRKSEVAAKLKEFVKQLKTEKALR